jgi:trimeric autotransporter adhesin
MSLASQLSFLESSTSYVDQISNSFVFTTNSVERLRITSAGGIAFGGSANFGTTGQVLQSNGNAPPTWVNAASNAINLSTNRTNWATNGTITAVVGQLAWKNYGNNHTIFDASQGTSPDGGAVNNTNAAVAWTGTYPTLMGWNGSSTYGVRVDSARVADSSAQVNTVAQPVNAIYYPTFVDANNATATGESLFTTSSFSVNPSIPQVSINASIVQGGSSAQGLDLVLRGGTGASSEGPQIVMGYGNNTTSAIIGQANRTWNIDVASGAANNNFRIFRVNSVGASAVAVEITESNGGIQLLSLGVGTAPSGTTGEIRATNEVTAYYSDRRLKENIKPIDNAVEKVSKLNGITYKPNDLARSFGYISNRTIVGLFADEVDVVLPEAVRPAPFDQDENGNSKSGENYQTIQYEKLVPLLVEAIKEQQKQINQLIKTVATLSNK